MSVRSPFRLPLPGTRLLRRIAMLACGLGLVAATLTPPPATAAPAATSTQTKPRARGARLPFENSGKRTTVTTIVGVSLHDGDGHVIDNATVEMRGPRITDISVGGVPTPEAEVIDGRGKWLTPGFIAAHTPLGLVEIDMEGSTNDASRNTDPIRANHDAALAVHASSSLLAIQAVEGVTTAAVTPRGGLISGQVAWIDLLTGHHTDIVARSRVAVAGGLGQRVGGSRAATLARFEEVFDDAAFYRSRRAAFDRRQSRDLSAHRLDLDALGPVLGREVPLVVGVERASDILALADFATRNKLRVVAAGASQAWQVAEALRDANIPVIVQPSRNLPTSFDRMGSRLDAAALLHKQGVTVAIAVLGEAHNVRNVSQEAGIAVANGLPPEVALSAVSRNVAAVYGMDDNYGTVAVGQVANVVLWPGDPFELANMPEAVFIRGEAIEMTTRQTKLRDRYLHLAKPTP